VGHTVKAKHKERQVAVFQAKFLSVLLAGAQPASTTQKLLQKLRKPRIECAFYSQKKCPVLPRFFCEFANVTVCRDPKPHTSKKTTLTPSHRGHNEVSLTQRAQRGVTHTEGTTRCHSHRGHNEVSLTQRAQRGVTQTEGTTRCHSHRGHNEVSLKQNAPGPHRPASYRTRTISADKRQQQHHWLAINIPPTSLDMLLGLSTGFKGVKQNRCRSFNPHNLQVAYV
jgi:hypothetical protein